MNLLTCLIKLGCFHALSNTLSIKETFLFYAAYSMLKGKFI